MLVARRYGTLRSEVDELGDVGTDESQSHVECSLLAESAVALVSLAAGQVPLEVLERGFLTLARDEQR